MEDDSNCSFFFTFLRNVLGILNILSICKDGCGVMGSIAG